MKETREGGSTVREAGHVQRRCEMMLKYIERETDGYDKIGERQKY